jgi:hypothetical protein
MAVLFNVTISNSGSVGTEAWVDLGTITTGKEFWIGKAIYTSINKVAIFELRTNNIGQSTGTTANTKLLDTASVKTGSSLTRDLYKNGSLHITTVLSTGIEKLWLRVLTKNAIAGTYQYSVSYTVG